MRVYKRKNTYLIIPVFISIFSLFFVIVSVNNLLTKELPVEFLVFFIVSAVFFTLPIVWLVVKHVIRVEIEKNKVVLYTMIGKQELSDIKYISLGLTRLSFGILIKTKDRKAGIGFVTYFEKYKEMFRELEKATGIKIYQNPIVKKIEY